MQRECRVLSRIALKITATKKAEWTYFVRNACTGQYTQAHNKLVTSPEKQPVLGGYHPEPLEAAGLDVLDAVPLVQHQVVVPKP